LIVSALPDGELRRRLSGPGIRLRLGPVVANIGSPFESVASANLSPQRTVDVLTDAYRKYRERSHHLSLEQAEPVVDAAEFATQRAAVTAIWNATMDETTRPAPL